MTDLSFIQPTKRRKMTKAAIEPGDRFGRLTVISRQSGRKYLCQCDCGKRTLVFGSNLTRRHSQSCGCLALERVTTHSRSRSPEYKTWMNIRSRCANCNTPYWDQYGGRGISVCKRWEQSFEAFLSDMGPRPSKRHSIDRIDVDGDYEPGNCRWALATVQARNTRRQRYVQWNGRRMTLAEAVESSSVTYNTVLYRLKRGWSLHDAITRPQQRGVKP